MNKKLNATLLLSVLLIPLLPTYSSFGFEQVKIIFLILILSLGAIFWIYGYFKEPDQYQTKWTNINRAALGFILVLILTSFLGIDFTKSFLGEYPYFQGLILYLYLYLFYLLVVFSKIPIYKWGIVLNISSVAVSLVAIRQWIQLEILNQEIVTYAGRIISTFGQPNFYAGFLLLTLPFSYLIFQNSNKKISYFGLVSGIISIIGIFVSYSRVAILLALILLVLALINELKVKFKVIAIFMVIIFLSITFTTLASLKFSSGIVWRELAEPLNNQWLIDNSPEKRVFIWPVIAKLIMQKPLEGYGLENMAVAFSSFFAGINFNITSIPVYHTLKDLQINRSHSYALDLLFFSGILGLLLWVLLVILTIRKTKSQTLLACMLIYLVWIQFQNQSVVHLLYFWLIVGLTDQK